MRSREESSSEFAVARRISRRLSEGSRTSPAEVIAAESGYVRFSAAQWGDAPGVPAGGPSLAPPPPSAAAPRMPATPQVTFEDREFEQWQDLVAWALDVTSSDASFVVGPQGFIIAFAGAMSFDDIEAIGTQLQTTARRSQQIIEGSLVHAIVLRIDDMWVTGLNFPAEHEVGVFTLGFIGGDSLDKHVREGITDLVKVNIERL